MNYEDYLKTAPDDRVKYYQRDDRMYHVMRTQQFDTSLLEELFEIANQIKLMTRKPNGIDFLKSLLRHKKAMLYFTQPSTRTFLSFLGALLNVVLFLRQTHLVLLSPLRPFPLSLTVLVSIWLVYR